MSTRHACNHETSSTINTAYRDELIHNPLIAQNSKMTVGWMF